MDNDQQYHHVGPMNPRMDFRSQRPPSLRNTQPYQNNDIPLSSYQNPVPPQACNAFPGDNSTQAAFHRPPTPSYAFHSYRFPPPDFSCPPPLQSPGNSQFSQFSEMQQDQNFGSASALSPSQGVYNHPTPPPTFMDPFSDTAMESSHPQSTFGELDMYEDSKGKDEQLWLRNFEQRILERSTQQRNESVTAKERPIKLSDVQQMVSQSRILTNKLRQLKEKMTVMRDDVSDQTWFDFVDQAETAKLELSGITQKFQDKLFMDKVRLLIHQRRKKRERTKKQHKRKIQQKNELKLLWKKEEEKIDAWREKLYREEQEKRREAAIKTEADNIMGEVRQKQSDGIKMQQLLENLISLRIVRLNKGAAHGFISTPQQDQLFTTTIKRIAEVVKTQMAEYELEEQTLHVMMEESTSYQRSTAGRDPTDAVKKLETLMKKALFGDEAQVIDREIYDEYTAADHSKEILLQRRKEWDQFICKEDTPLSSSVPLSWVIPPSQPTAPWKEFQG